MKSNQGKQQVETQKHKIEQSRGILQKRNKEIELKKGLN